MSAVRTLAAFLLLLRLAGSLLLSALNRAEIRRRAAAPPPAIAAIMDGPTYARAVEYSLARSRLSVVTEIADTVVVGAAVFSGALPWLYGRMAGWSSPGAAWVGALFLLLAAALLSLPSLPFDLWEQFRLEAKFGFNRMSAPLWMADKLKSAAVGFALGMPLLWCLLALVARVGAWWWAWGALLVFGFQAAMAALFPTLILPLFNRLVPLPEGPLRERLMALGERTGFRASTIQLMDGSRRSGHSNAFFTGFGRWRRIVLFDTLVSQLGHEELEAVLAHEIGHYRLGHVPKRLALAFGTLLGSFALVAWLARSAWFNASFGYPPGAVAASFLLCMLLGGAAAFCLSPVWNGLSRRHEYAADAFAREAVGGPAPVVAALRRLAERNLSNLTPHPWFSAFHYSHPTAVERERALTEETARR